MRRRASSEHRITGLHTGVLGDNIPAFRLRGPHAQQHVRNEECARPVAVCRVALGIKPAVVGEVLADLLFKLDFLILAHSAPKVAGTLRVPSDSADGTLSGPSDLQ